jgi:hypothetical protein
VSVSQPVERVVTLLCEASYERLPQPVAVAGIPFEFSAVLAASSSLDLVVVVDSVTETDVANIRRRVEGLSRALDLVDSRRPLTVVLIGPEPVLELQLALSRVARVLFAGVPSGERELREAIAVLLPLDVVTVADMPESWRSARDKLLVGHPHAADLLEAAKVGSDAVAETARRHLLSASPGEGETL